MELALFLVLIVLAELVLTVFMVARHREYLNRVKRLERNVGKLAEVMRDYGMEDKRDAALFQGAAAPASGLSDLISQATPEDLEQARAILEKFGIGE